MVCIFPNKVSFLNKTAYLLCKHSCHVYIISIYPISSIYPQVVGIITRHDLTHEHLHSAFHKKTSYNNENGFQEEVDLFTRIKRALGCL